MTAARPTPVGSEARLIAVGRACRYKALRQLPRRSPDRRRHSGATTRTSQPRLQIWSSMRAALWDKPSDVELAPCTKNRIPLGRAGGARVVATPERERELFAIAQRVAP